ncbi:MAG: adenine phosphoribosyltransferase [Acidimicrobiales bacterium]
MSPEATADSTGTPRLVADLVRDVADFPRPGVVFKDITPVLADARAFAASVSWMAGAFDGAVDKVVAVEARGFILGGPVAYALGAGLVPVRKVGKLPAATVAEGYTLEYGESTLEMHVDALAPGDRVLVVDDVIATGGTALATIALIRRAGATLVGVVALLELGALGGRARLAGHDVRVMLAT